ncbi:hypothetical protein PCE1_001399 [Barthelona sp. PCE]
MGENVDFKSIREQLKAYIENPALEGKESIDAVQEVFSIENIATSDMGVLFNEGIEFMKEHLCGACVMAGGQGTRLGFDHPKGMYPAGPHSNKSLFQLFAERILRLNKLSGVRIPFFIMTSLLNDAETKRFFRTNDFFGLSEEDVIFFSQTGLPAMNKEGELLNNPDGTLTNLPDGNGAIFSVFPVHELESRNIEYVHIFSVDNVLVLPCDPIFMHYTHKQEADAALKSVLRLPRERAGAIIARGGGVRVVEYSELPEEEEDCTPFTEANIANHIFSTVLMKSLLEEPLPYHFAHKKIPCEEEYEPQEPNAYKIEKFIFDALERSVKTAVMRTERHVEFGPFKNANGAAKDTPEQGQQMLLDLHHSWTGAHAEVSPLKSYCGEGYVF